MELKDSAGRLEGLHKTVSVLHIQRFHAHIQLIVRNRIEPVRNCQIEWRNQEIPGQREPGDFLLKHRLTADHDTDRFFRSTSI